MLSDPTVLLCGKLCEELLSFILEHTEHKLQRMTNSTAVKRNLQTINAGDFRFGGQWSTGREMKWL